MATQLSLARQGVITDEMRAVAEDEGLDAERVRLGVARGTLVIPKNVHHAFRPSGIGQGLRTKVNVNLGASGCHSQLDEELEKLELAIRYGSDAVMDLSTGSDLDAIRARIIGRSTLSLGTVPIYQVASERDIEFDPEELFACIERQAEQGVDFMTVHCGVTRETVARARASGRLLGIVSRGGAVMAAWMTKTGRENPLYEQFDRLCQIFHRHDVTFSLGDGLRPGANHDAHDAGQVSELLVLGELAERARRHGCQVMIEGPGHMRLDEIEATVRLEKRICQGAPFYVLGPLVTDVAPGYDHITAAIGGAIAAAAGADMLCYVTPAEHLRLPDKQDVIDGLVATRIAAHSGDLAKGVPGAGEWDDMMSRCRRRLDWEGMFRLAIDPIKPRHYKLSSEAAEAQYCTMCGPLCSVRLDGQAQGASAAGADTDKDHGKAPIQRPVM